MFFFLSAALSIFFTDFSICVYMKVDFFLVLVVVVVGVRKSGMFLFCELLVGDSRGCFDSLHSHTG